jgi:hypothetical protein
MFPKNWSANNRRPVFSAQPSRKLKKCVEDVTWHNETRGRTERYSKFIYKRRWSAEIVV